MNEPSENKMDLITNRLNKIDKMGKWLEVQKINYSIYWNIIRNTCKFLQYIINYIN